MLKQAKRFSYVPLLVLVGVITGGSSASATHAPLLFGNIIGAVAALGVAVIIERRRRINQY